MTIPINILAIMIIAFSISGGIFGYAICYFRYNIPNLIKVVDITADIIAEKMTPEEAIKEIKKLD